MDKIPRLQISVEQKNKLISYHERGMNSTKREMASLIRQCAAEVLLSEDQNWINNYNSKLNGSGNRQTPCRSKQQLHRRQSGYNLFTHDILQKDKIGGSADVFRTVGEKWRDLDEESREQYRKKAREDCDNLALQPSKSERALKIINNMMREVAELESLGGQGMVLCTYNGMIYNGESAICQKLVVDKDLIKSFGSLLQLTDMEKGEVSIKDLQELFNSKYGELVGKTGQKMPYVKAKQLGIVFQGLPDTLATDIEVVPRKPQLYGSAQRRKLWLARDEWKFVISDSIITSSSTITRPQASQISPPSSLVSSCSTIATIVTSPSTAVTSTSTIVASPSSIVTSPSTIVPSPGTIVNPSSTIVNSPSTVVTSPSTVVDPSSTIISPRSTINMPRSTVVTSPSTSITLPSSLITQSTSFPTTSTLRVAPSTSPSSFFSMASSAGNSLSSISSPS